MTIGEDQTTPRWSLPKSWEWMAVGSIGGVSLGRQRSPINHSGPYMRRYVRAANITWRGWDFSDVKEMNFDADDFERFRLYPGDVLVNEGSGSAKEVGKPAIWDGQIQNCCFQNTLVRVQPKACSSEYLYAYFLFSALTERFVSATQGVNIYHIGKEGVANFPIPIPPLNEQRRIVTKIDSLSAKSKRARDQLDHVARMVEKYKQAILAAAFRRETPDAKTASVGDIADIQSGSGFPKEYQGKTTGDYPFAKVSDISRAVTNEKGLLASAANYVDQSDLKVLRAKPVSEGSTIFAKIGEALRLNRRAITAVPAILDNNCMALVPDRVRVQPRYLYWFMRTVDLSPFAVATAVPSVRRSDVAALEVRLPSLEIQQQIIDSIETAYAWIERLAGEATNARKLIDRLDQAVLAKAFQGELVPQDPTDEPASTLLDRIRAEHAEASAKPSKRIRLQKRQR